MDDVHWDGIRTANSGCGEDERLFYILGSLDTVELCSYLLSRAFITVQQGMRAPVCGDAIPE